MLKGLLSKLKSKLSGPKEEPKPPKPEEPIAAPVSESKPQKPEPKSRLNFTLWTDEQIQGEHALDFLKQGGYRVGATDLAIVLGGNGGSEYSRAFNGTVACTALRASSNNKGEVHVDDPYWGADGIWLQPNFTRNSCMRPVLLPEETAKIGMVAMENWGDFDVVEYGEYPQRVVQYNTNFIKTLEKLYETQALQKTGKTYTFDSTEYNKCDVGFQPDVCPEYEYQGKKYIRVLGREHDLWGGGRLDGGRGFSSSPGEPHWVMVEPIRWYVDKSGTWISEKCLFAGVQFDTGERYDGDFSKTFIKHYLDTYFAKEIETPQMVADRERKAAFKTMKEKLAEISDLEKVKVTIKPARTPERTETLARITRVRHAKATLSAMAQRAYSEGDEEMLKEIGEMARPFAAREAAIRNKFNLKRAERRAKKGRG